MKSTSTTHIYFGTSFDLFFDRIDLIIDSNVNNLSGSWWRHPSESVNSDQLFPCFLLILFSLKISKIPWIFFKDDVDFVHKLALRNEKAFETLSPLFKLCTFSSLMIVYFKKIEGNSQSLEWQEKLFSKMSKWLRICWQWLEWLNYLPITAGNVYQGSRMEQRRKVCAWQNNSCQQTTNY